MRKLLRNVAFVTVFLLAVIALIWYSTRPEPIKVVVVTPEYGSVHATVSNTRVGTIKPCRRAHLAPATGGQVAKITVTEGDNAKKDQVLMEVWNKDLQARVNLETAESVSLRARAAQACALADGADREAKRRLNLQQRQQIISKEQVDSAVTDAKAQRAACHAALASIEVNKARIAEAQATLERTLVRAPFAGVVAEINVELGEYVTPSPPGIATLPAIDFLDISCLYVSAPIDEVDAPLVKTGMNACVSLDAFPRDRCSGTVTRIAPYVLEKEKQARTVEVEVTIREAKDLKGLLPGYSADIEVSLMSHENVLRIPTEAIIDGDRVFVVNADNTLSDRKISPGISNWKYTEVSAGLDQGERVVLSVGREGVADGVGIVEEDQHL